MTDQELIARTERQSAELAAPAAPAANSRLHEVGESREVCIAEITPIPAGHGVDRLDSCLARGERSVADGPGPAHGAAPTANDPAGHGVDRSDSFFGRAHGPAPTIAYAVLGRAANENLSFVSSASSVAKPSASSYRRFSASAFIGIPRPFLAGYVVDRSVMRPT